MTKMTQAQRTAILDAHERRLRRIGRTGGADGDPRVIRVLKREGWVSGYFDSPTRAGLIAAGVDMNAIHAEALTEDYARRVSASALADTFGGTVLTLADALPTVATEHIEIDTDVWEEPRYPKGTPEYAAYETELKTELRKWVAGEEPYSRASIADEVAMLRREIHETVIPRMDDRDRFREGLDRIAALVPQRATYWGSSIQQHACGRPHTFALTPPYCCANPGGWRALYTVGE